MKTIDPVLSPPLKLTGVDEMRLLFGTIVAHCLSAESVIEKNHLSMTVLGNQNLLVISLL